MIMAEALDTLEVKRKYFISEDREKLKARRQGYPWSDSLPGESLTATKTPGGGS